MLFSFLRTHAQVVNPNVPRRTDGRNIIQDRSLWADRIFIIPRYTTTPNLNGGADTVGYIGFNSGDSTINIRGTGIWFPFPSKAWILNQITGNIPTWQNVTSVANGNNSNKIIQIKGLGGAVLPGYALEMFMDSTSTPKTGNVNAINRPSGVPIELRLNYLSGTYASPATIRLGGAGNDITVVGGNGIDSGHTNLIASGSHSFAITTITNSTILDNTYFTVLGNNSSNIVVTLPTASSCTGRIYHLKKISNNANTITVNSATGITIDGNSTDVITTFNQSRTYQSSGTVWIIL
jgi:hypothetical protein